MPLFNRYSIDELRDIHTQLATTPSQSIAVGDSIIKTHENSLNVHQEIFSNPSNSANEFRFGTVKITRDLNAFEDQLYVVPNASSVKDYVDNKVTAAVEGGIRYIGQVQLFSGCSDTFASIRDFDMKRGDMYRFTGTDSTYCNYNGIQFRNGDFVIANTDVASGTPKTNSHFDWYNTQDADVVKLEANQVLINKDLRHISNQFPRANTCTFGTVKIAPEMVGCINCSNYVGCSVTNTVHTSSFVDNALRRKLTTVWQSEFNLDKIINGGIGVNCSCRFDTFSHYVDASIFHGRSRCSGTTPDIHKIIDGTDSFIFNFSCGTNTIIPPANRSTYLSFNFGVSNLVENFVSAGDYFDKLVATNPNSGLNCQAEIPATFKSAINNLGILFKYPVSKYFNTEFWLDTACLIKPAPGGCNTYLAVETLATEEYVKQIVSSNKTKYDKQLIKPVLDSVYPHVEQYDLSGQKRSEFGTSCIVEGFTPGHYQSNITWKVDELYDYSVYCPTCSGFLVQGTSEFYLGESEAATMLRSTIDDKNNASTKFFYKIQEGSSLFWPGISSDVQAVLFRGPSGCLPINSEPKISSSGHYEFFAPRNGLGINEDGYLINYIPNCTDSSLQGSEFTKEYGANYTPVKSACIDIKLKTTRTFWYGYDDKDDWACSMFNYTAGNTPRNLANALDLYTNNAGHTCFKSCTIDDIYIDDMELYLGNMNCALTDDYTANKHFYIVLPQTISNIKSIKDESGLEQIRNFIPLTDKFCGLYYQKDGKAVHLKVYEYNTPGRVSDSITISKTFRLDEPRRKTEAQFDRYTQPNSQP